MKQRLLIIMFIIVSFVISMTPPCGGGHYAEDGSCLGKSFYEN